MITLVVHNLYTGSEQQYEVSRIYDFDKIAADYGDQIYAVIDGLQNTRAAADRVAEYLSNNHLQVEVLDSEDAEEIYDPNVENFEKEVNKPQKAVDLKDMLENYAKIENVDIPEMHTINSATHRWDK